MTESFQSRLYRFAEAHPAEALPPWTAAKADDQADDGEEAGGVGVKISVGMRRSLAVPLDEETWTPAPAIMQASNLSAAIYKLKYGRKIGFVRIPRYTPILLTHTPTRCRVIPVAGIKLGIGRRRCVASDAEQRTEGVERVEASVEPKREFVEVGL